MNLKLVLLALLSKKPNTGYGIDQILQRHAPHLWSSSLQHIYSELANLQADGLAVARCVEEPNRSVKKKIYTLTTLGEEKLDRLLAETITPPAIKDELLIRLYCIDRIPSEALGRELSAHVHELEHEESIVNQEVIRTPQSETGALLTLQLVRGRLRERLDSCRKILVALDHASQDESPQAMEAAG